MKELNDKDFDQIFKTRITEELPEFEEESWSKMERKLRKKDRLVFYRNASIILLLLSFGLGFYYANKKNTFKAETVAIKKHGNKKAPNLSGPAPLKMPIVPVTAGSNGLITKNSAPIKNKAVQKEYNNTQSLTIVQPSIQSTIPNVQETAARLNMTATTPSTAEIEESPIELQKQAGQQVIAKVEVKNVEANKSIEPKKNEKGPRQKIPFSLAIAVGPDFNSTTAIIGGKTNLAFGVSIGIGITKKISVQTGLNYGHKNYNANAFNYTFNNPNTKNTIAEVNAACKVIEIPLRASLNISENQQRRIAINAGLSSYLMVKENYIYQYKTESGRTNRLVEVDNKNRHILSVIDLSATYSIKLKNKKLAFGIEPYLKIPLTGIGEGSVPLKSSGISLKLSYDFNKR